MRVELDGGAVIDLGTTEAAPTIGITDYSRRVTDDFGATTVVERSFSRRMSVRLALPFANVDALQRDLVDLRATAALWVASDDLASLSVRGFYKDFSLDFATPPISFCTLTIEGLAEADPFTDTGIDPAADGRTSTLRLLQPQTVTSAILTASSVAETDYPEWAVGTNYPLGARVIKGSLHRIFESVAGANIGNDPAASDKWLDVAPTNRWAMFDQALGTLTTAAGSIVVTLDPADAVNSLALLDVTAATVRVQAADYDRTIAPAQQPGMALFLDMPETAGAITITIMGSGAVSVGTLLIGRLVGLGVTEASPSAGIADFSRKETDDFGEVTVVERAWAKRMSVAGLIRTDAVDVVAGRIAAVRARPSLWIGEEGLESVTVYGFFKDFSIEVGENVSKLSLSIEGLSKAAPLADIQIARLVVVYQNAVAPPGAPALGSGPLPEGWTDAPQPVSSGQYRWVTQAEFRGTDQLTAWTLPVRMFGTSWVDVIDDDPVNPKPESGATVGAPSGTPVHDRLAEQVASDLDLNALNILAEMTTAGTWRGETDEIIYTDDGTPIRTIVEQLGVTSNGHTLYITSLQEVNADTGTSKFVFAANADGTIVGIEGLAGGGQDFLAFMASKFYFVDNSGENPVRALSYEGGVWKMASIEVDTLKVNTAVIPIIVSQTTSFGGTGSYINLMSATLNLPKPGVVKVSGAAMQGFSDIPRAWRFQVLINGVVVWEPNGSYPGDTVALQGNRFCDAGTVTVGLRWVGAPGVDLHAREILIEAMPNTE